MNAHGFAVIALWAAVSAGAAETAEIRYAPYRFEASENWRVTASGDSGASRLDGNRWTLDFTRGAKWIALVPPDRVLLGTPKRFHLRVSGGAASYPVRLSLYTHFMTFHGPARDLGGSGERELVFEAPPGPGWTWEEGENDGRLHGPLRVAEIRVESGATGGAVELQLLGLDVETAAPADRRCVLTASTGASTSGVRFRPEIRCLAGEPLEGVLRWRFRDWDGNDAGEGRRPVRVNPLAVPVSLEVTAPPLREAQRFLEAEFSLEIPGQKVPAVATAWVGNLAAHGDSELRPSSPFGMGVYLGRFEGEDMQATARAARDAGVKWSREDFEWQRIEPERGRFEWSFHDNLVATAKRNGISVYAIVAGWPSWTKPYTDEGIADWLVFLRQLVRHYKGDIHQWEIWNEPNIFFWQGPRDLYASFLTKSYAAVKEEDPSAEVLGLSTSGIDYNYIARMMAFEAPFDILTIHPYRKVLDDRMFINELKIVSDLIRLPDGRRRPVWLTEMGWSTYVPHNTLKQDFEPFRLRDNAQLLARAYLCSLVSGVEPRTFWYDFRNDGEDPLYFENELGVVYRDFRPKPSYAAYSTLTRVLKNRRFNGQVPTEKGVFAYRFDGDGTVYAVWSTRKDLVAAVTLDTGSPTVTIVNTVGESRDLKTDSGRLTLRLKPDAPVYVIGGKQ